jgi:hypothetical protein
VLDKSEKVTDSSEDDAGGACNQRENREHKRDDLQYERGEHQTVNVVKSFADLEQETTYMTGAKRVIISVMSKAIMVITASVVDCCRCR